MNKCAHLFMILGSVACSQSLLAHEGVMNSAPWDACSDKQQSNVCAFTNSHEDIYRGTCQVMAESLYCVRNQPIVRSEDLQFSVVEQEDGHGHEETHDHHE